MTQPEVYVPDLLRFAGLDPTADSTAGIVPDSIGAGSAGVLSPAVRALCDELHGRLTQCHALSR